MSVMSDLDLTLAEISKAMGEPVTEQELAESLVAQRVNSIISDLDELCALAAKSETANLIIAEKIAVGQIITRAQLLASFITAQKTPAFRLVR